MTTQLMQIYCTLDKLLRKKQIKSYILKKLKESMKGERGGKAQMG